MTDSRTLQASQTFEILTPRLRLRPMRMNDAKDLWNMRRRGECRKYDKGIVDLTIDVTENWIREKVFDSYTVFNLVVELRDQDDYIRNPPPWTSNTPPPPLGSMEPSPETTETLPDLVIGALGVFNGPEVGYSLHPAYQGRGYATEALRAFTEYYWTWWPRAPAGSASHHHSEDKNDRAIDSRTALAEGDPYAAPIINGVSSDEVSTNADEQQHQQPSRTTPWPQPEDGTDYMQADTDPENYASGAVLRKVGFVPWSSTFDDFHSEMLGTRSTLMFRLARPGTTLPQAPYYDTAQVEERERRAREGKWPRGI